MLLKSLIIIKIPTFFNFELFCNFSLGTSNCSLVSEMPMKFPPFNENMFWRKIYDGKIFILNSLALYILCNNILCSNILLRFNAYTVFNNILNFRNLVLIYMLKTYKSFHKTPCYNPISSSVELNVYMTRCYNRMVYLVY